MSDIPVSFGEWVQTRRKQLDLTRNALAAEVGCSPVTIKKIERDERKPSRQIAELLATHLEIPAEQQTIFVQKARGHFVDAGVVAVLQHQAAAVPAAEKQHHSHGNLPEQTTPLVGRQAEIGQLTDILDDPTQRLISLIGTGGMGKSRLAVELAQRYSQKEEHRFQDGIFYVDFNAHRDQSHIVPAIAKAVGVAIKKERRQPQDQLFDYLRPKSILLILDNFDDLIDDADFISTLLETAPALKILVTSRERLNLQQEQIFPVQGLKVPPSDFVEIGQLEDFPAVELFLETARRIQPEFALTAENGGPVGRLCQILEGMPLSIELAAAWIDLLSPAEIAEEIRKSLDFLETNLRDFPKRHRSMRAVFDASWEKLEQAEKKTFARLSIFQGGFSRRAARSVAGAGLPVLGRLVDRSLLRYDGRLLMYQINDLLRQYAEDQLAELESADARADLHDRHSVYYLEALAEQSDAIKGDGQKRALDIIGRDMKNVKMAWRWAVEHFKQDLILTGMEPLANFLDFRGRYDEGEKTFHDFVEKLKQRAEKTAEKRLLLFGYSWLSVFERLCGKPDQAQKSLNAADALIQQFIDAGEAVDREQAFVFALTGRLKAADNLADGKVYYLKALELYRAQKMDWEQAAMMKTLGSLVRLEGDYSKANSWYEESLQIQQRIGDQIGAAETLANMSGVSRYRGQFFEAMIMAQNSVDLARKISNDNVLALGLVDLGMSYYYVGEFEKQQKCLTESLAIYESLNNISQLPEVLYRLSLGYAALGQYDEAVTQAQNGLHLARQTGNTVQTANLLYAQGIVSLAVGSFDSAKQGLEDSLAIFPEIGQQTHRQSGMITLIGFAEYNLGNPTPAKRHFYKALSAAIGRADQIALNLVFGVAGLVLADDGCKTKGVILWKMAQRFSPPFQNADWLRQLYGDRMAEIEEELSAAELEQIDDHLAHNSMFDEAEALLALMNENGWG